MAEQESLKRILVMVSLGHFLTEHYSVMLPPIFPLLITDLDIGYVKAGLLVTVYFGTYSVFQMFSGMLADRWSKKYTLILGMILLSTGMMLTGLAPNYYYMILAQVIAGIGGSTYHPTGFGMLAARLAKRRLGLGMGVHGVFGSMGMAMSPLTVTFFSLLIGWRWALILLAVPGLVYSLVFQLMIARQKSTYEKFSTEKRRLLFVPILILSFVFIFQGMGAQGLITYTTSFLYEIYSMDLTAANSILAIFIAAGISQLLGGVLADRYNKEVTIILCLMVSSIFTLVIAFFVLPHGLIWVIFAIIGVGHSMIFPVINVITSELADGKNLSTIFGFLTTVNTIGVAIVPVTFGIVATVMGLKEVFIFAGVFIGISAGFMAFYAVKVSWGRNPST